MKPAGIAVRRAVPDWSLTVPRDAKGKPGLCERSNCCPAKRGQKRPAEKLWRKKRPANSL